jgi:hypothetical protein
VTTRCAPGRKQRAAGQLSSLPTFAHRRAVSRRRRRGGMVAGTRLTLPLATAAVVWRAPASHNQHFEAARFNGCSGCTCHQAVRGRNRRLSLLLRRGNAFPTGGAHRPLGLRGLRGGCLRLLGAPLDSSSTSTVAPSPFCDERRRSLSALVLQCQIRQLDVRRDRPTKLA